MRRTLLTCSAVLALVALLPSAAAAGMSDPGSAASSAAAFSAPVVAAAGRFDDLSVVVDTNGHVHIAATRRGDIWYLTNRTGTWSEHRVMASGRSVDYAGALVALDADGRVFIAATRLKGPGIPWSEGIDLVTDRGRSPGSFSSPSRVTSNAVLASNLKIVHGHPALVLEIYQCCAANGPNLLWYQIRTRAGWSRQLIDAHGIGASMRLDPGTGLPVIAYRALNQIRLATATSIAGDFRHEMVPGSLGLDSSPSLALDTAGDPSVFWFSWAAYDVRLAGKTAAGWSMETIPKLSPDGWGSFEVDTLNRPHIVWYDEESHALSDRRQHGATWTTRTIASGTSFFNLTARRAPGGRVVVVWTTEKAIFVSAG